MISEVLHKLSDAQVVVKLFREMHQSGLENCKKPTQKRIFLKHQFNVSQILVMSLDHKSKFSLMKSR